MQPLGRACPVSIDHNRRTKEELRVLSLLPSAGNGSPGTRKNPTSPLDPEKTENPADQRSSPFDRDFFEDGQD